MSPAYGVGPHACHVFCASPCSSPASPVTALLFAMATCEPYLHAGMEKAQRKHVALTSFDTGVRKGAFRYSYVGCLWPWSAYAPSLLRVALLVFRSLLVPVLTAMFAITTCEPYLHAGMEEAQRKHVGLTSLDSANTRVRKGVFQHSYAGYLWTSLIYMPFLLRVALLVFRSPLMLVPTATLGIATCEPHLHADIDQVQRLHMQITSLDTSACSFEVRNSYRLIRIRDRIGLASYGGSVWTGPHASALLRMPDQDSIDIYRPPLHHLGSGLRGMM